MQEYRVSNRSARSLDRVVSSGAFKSPEDVLRHLINAYASELIIHTAQGIDLQPADGGAHRTQQQWIALYNAQEGEFKGKRMIASYDVIGAPSSASPKLLASLQKDCVEYWIITSTHNSYQRSTLAGNVIHNYQSTVVRPKIIYLDEIPVLQGEPASKVVEMPGGLLYIRALANDRHAKPAALLNGLVALAQREPEDIFFHTPDQDSRNMDSERAVRFGDGGGGFHVGGGSRFVNGNGRSRGVFVSPRSGRAKK